MRRILIIAATIAVTASAVRAEDAPSSNSPSRGSNFPTSQRGPAFPATTSNQQSNPSFGAQAPAPQQRWEPLHAQPEGRSSHRAGRHEDRTRALR
jgi:hypothetical protein